jgi:hypothetical protein
VQHRGIKVTDRTAAGFQVLTGQRQELPRRIHSRAIGMVEAAPVDLEQRQAQRIHQEMIPPVLPPALPHARRGNQQQSNPLLRLARPIAFAARWNVGWAGPAIGSSWSGDRI